MKRRKLLPRKTIFRADVSPVSQISTNERRSRKVCSSSLFVNGEREKEKERTDDLLRSIPLFQSL